MHKQKHQHKRQYQESKGNRSIVDNDNNEGIDKNDNDDSNKMLRMIRMIVMKW